LDALISLDTYEQLNEPYSGMLILPSKLVVERESISGVYTGCPFSKKVESTSMVTSPVDKLLPISLSSSSHEENSIDMAAKQAAPLNKYLFFIREK
jgi:hypothetical protein